MMITGDYKIYHLPCGDFCSKTCLDQAEAAPSTLVRHVVKHMVDQGMKQTTSLRDGFFAPRERHFFLLLLSTQEAFPIFRVKNIARAPTHNDGGAGPCSRWQAVRRIYGSACEDQPRRLPHFRCTVPSRLHPPLLRPSPHANVAKLLGCFTDDVDGDRALEIEAEECDDGEQAMSPEVSFDDATPG